jgi:hypothetical protein
LANTQVHHISRNASSESGRDHLKYGSIKKKKKIRKTSRSKSKDKSMKKLKYSMREVNPGVIYIPNRYDDKNPNADLNGQVMPCYRARSS